jgi:hypothetical protein
MEQESVQVKLNPTDKSVKHETPKHSIDHLANNQDD